MPTISSYVNGSTAGSPPPPRDHSNDAKRGAVKGWSVDAVRRHTKFLYSIESDRLDGLGFAATLTIRDCPATAAEWTQAREAFFVRLRRAGMLRGHWLTEWQKRKVPHLHCAIYFPVDMDPNFAWCMIYGHWLAVVQEKFGAQVRAQDVKRIDGPLGWLKYLSKHASRGVRHYQREGIPEGWEKSGRLWGKLGDWPEVAPLRFEMSKAAYWRYRRLCRSWRVADARKSGNGSRIKYARRMLASADPKLSSVRGVSDWMPEGITLGLVALLASEGELILEKE